MTTTTTTPELHELLRGIESLPCSYSRRKMRDVLQRMAGQRVFLCRRALVAPDEVMMAARLLDDMTRREASAALMVRLNCSRRKSYNLIARALNIRGQVKHDAAHAD
ncbi:MAG TPA: hypothetical protein VLJ62_30370 [Burkholderiaceae bacterium]|nr:hypothetical protein [Burkholderiaceae bacterium]